MIHQSKHVNFIPEQLKKNLQLLDKYIFGAGPSSFPVGPLACLSASLAHSGKLTLQRVQFLLSCFSQVTPLLEILKGKKSNLVPNSHQKSMARGHLNSPSTFNNLLFTTRIAFWFCFIFCFEAPPDHLSLAWFGEFYLLA